MVEKLKSFRVPVFFSGPYSYDAAPVEKIFAAIKRCDLNKQGRSFQSRVKTDKYLVWLAETISQIEFGNVSGLFRRALTTWEQYLLF